MTKADRALAWIERQLSEGATVYISTYTKATKITPKRYASWPSDRPLFKVSGSDLLMARGRRYDCIISGSIRLVGITARHES